MGIFRPNELLQYLESLGVAPRKALSQNFLIDRNVLDKIVRQAGVSEGDLVVEIGPGPGALTEQLLAAGAEVIAIEKDRVLAGGLADRLKSERLTVHCEDVLSFPLRETLKGRRAKVIANLPYNITTPILEMCMPLHDVLESLTVMVQEEVARRMTADAGGRVYGSLSVFLRFFGEPRYGFRVKPGCFFPPPSVDSAVVTVVLREPPEVDQDRFFQISRTAFGQRRKMLRGSLKNVVSIEQMEAAGVDPKSRPEQLPLESWLALASA